MTHEETIARRNQWHEHLREATGPLALDRIDQIQPDPELLELLREIAQPPWPDEPEREIDYSTPLFAAILLGLMHDEQSVPVLIEGLHYAQEVDWDWYYDDAPAIFGLIGSTAVPLLIEEIQRVEREPERDPNPPFYYWNLVQSLAAIGRFHPEAIPAIATLAAERISDRTYDREYAAEPQPEPTTFEERMEVLTELPTRTEMWVDLNSELDVPQLGPIVDEFFERHGPGYRSAHYGDRAEYWKWVEDKKDRPSKSREQLIESYRRLYIQTTTPEPEPSPATTLAEERQIMREYGGYYDDERFVPQEPYVRAEPKVGRNEPCPCGSGKKYKKCCGR